MEFTRASELASIVRPGVLSWEEATVLDRHPALDARLSRAEESLRSDAPPDTAAVRRMYKQLGIDPTKTRPSNEALLRRVRRNEPLPRINVLVDIINWCSVEFQVPYGLYDAAHIEGPVTLRIGRDGEEYAGIRKDVVHVGGRLALLDSRGPFGNPTSDSARTMVTTATTRALVVIYAPAETTTTELERMLDTTAARIAEFAGGRESGRLQCT